MRSIEFPCSCPVDDLMIGGVCAHCGNTKITRIQILGDSVVHVCSETHLDNQIPVVDDRVYSHLKWDDVMKKFEELKIRIEWGMCKLCYKTLSQGKLFGEEAEEENQEVDQGAD